MKFPLRFLVPAVAFAVLVGFFVVGLRRDPSAIPSPLIGKPAPTFSLASLGDPAWKVGPADFVGKPWVLNVWATWCVGCREEHAALLAISRENPVPIMLSGFLLVVRSPYLLGIFALIALGSIAGVFMYNELLRLVEAGYPDLATRSQYLARVDLAVNVAACL